MVVTNRQLKYRARHNLKQSDYYKSNLSHSKRYDWSSVDWSKTDTELQKVIGCSFSTLSRQSTITYTGKSTRKLNRK